MEEVAIEEEEEIMKAEEAEVVKAVKVPKEVNSIEIREDHKLPDRQRNRMTNSKLLARSRSNEVAEEEATITE